METQQKKTLKTDGHSRHTDTANKHFKQTQLLNTTDKQILLTNCREINTTSTANNKHYQQTNTAKKHNNFRQTETQQTNRHLN